MKKYLFLLLSLSGVLKGAAQTGKRTLAGIWKCYLDDRITFEYLQLNSDGTGIKCFGRTVNGKDSLITDHITALRITKWEEKGDFLYLNSRNTVSYVLDPAFEIREIDSGTIELTGEHLKYDRYPPVLNRKEFARTVTYHRAERIKGEYGVATASCIVGPHTFAFTPIDSTTCMARYEGFDDLIPHLVSCQPGYVYAQHYNDPPYQFVVPVNVNNLDYGFGEGSFYLRLSSPEGDTPVTSIAIHYDFKGKEKAFFFTQLKEGKEKEDISKVDNKVIYNRTNWQGKFEGDIYMNHGIWIAYYTRRAELVPLLRHCIASFTYRGLTTP